MKARVKFVLEWERRWEDGEGRLNFVELCREFGISRQVKLHRTWGPKKLWAWRVH